MVRLYFVAQFNSNWVTSVSIPDTDQQIFYFLSIPEFWTSLIFLHNFGAHINYLNQLMTVSVRNRREIFSDSINKFINKKKKLTEFTYGDCSHLSSMLSTEGCFCGVF